jgi:hypothetical protein
MSRSFVGIAKPRQDRQMLYSFVNHWSVLEFVLKQFRPATLCEIGVEDGLLFDLLADSPDLVLREIQYFGIDPSIADAVRKKLEARGAQIVAEPSRAGISAIPACDLYLIDGDHNYPTVYSDLELISSHSGQESRSPLVILHDVCWPTDRRDAFYIPSYLDPNEMRPYSTDKGVRPDSDALVDSGAFMANSGYAWAIEYGGKHNGVLTAVEDFIDAQKGIWHYLIIPGCFGLGILYRPDSLNETQSRCIEDIARSVEVFSGLVESLEYNRLDLFCRIQSKEQQIQTKDQEVQAKEQQLQAKEQQIQSLQSEVRQKQTELDRCGKWLADLQQSHTWRWFARYTVGKNSLPLDVRPDRK